MIFEAARFCACDFISEFTGTDGEQTLAAPLVVVLDSSGRGHVQAGADEFLLTAGSLFLAADGARAAAEPESHLLAAGFSGMAAEELARALHGALLSDCGACPMAAQLLAALADSPDEAVAYRFLCELAHADEAGERLSPLVVQAVLTIRKEYASLYGVEELSRQLGVSTSHLVRMFSAEIGMPPGKYLTRVRIDAAKELLARGEYSLEIIATLCGFSGANYLCKVFRRETGLSPAAWRGRHGAQETPRGMSEAEKALFV